MKRLRLLFLLPTAGILLLLFAVPLCILLVYACMTRGAYGGTMPPFTGENWLRVLDPLYLGIVGRSFLVAGVSTLICVILGFPLALFISRSGTRKNLYLSLVMLPFWTSFLVRTYAWMFLLRDTGLINTTLQAMGVIHEPLPLLYNWWAVILGLVYGYLPFMVLPLFSTLERLDPSLLEAAADLGARPSQGMLRVMLPLSAPGIRAGAILVFIPCLGAYLTPDLLGGGRTILIGTLIQNQFSNSRDWPFGSAISLALMALVMLLLWIQVRRKGEPLL
ncbi:ABC transporter permease [Paludibaculum fermentans]|uniref:ABC transporter permease n=1 Tax=Paludibaculum fermentans TaxID=1473598 RepID=A0A7S7SJ92_PALFE|nr:ABC transporter permease [Paludibaculum fermentans]QOY87832.1 ABC transporter permease [Paludibaculum fermentans]